ncbi:MAG TPA: hypothetical protein VGX23_30430 [Actinocrinis sp.]|nr:hypothetical protein [Actinocrinis sp.]
MDQVQRQAAATTTNFPTCAPYTADIVSILAAYSQNSAAQACHL